MSKRRWGYVTAADWAAIRNRPPPLTLAGRMGAAAMLKVKAEKRQAGRKLAGVAAKLRAAERGRRWRNGWPAQARNPVSRAWGAAPWPAAWRVMLSRMVPGEWYSARELAGLVGKPIRTARLYTAQHAAPYLVRALNPNYDGVAPPRVAARYFVEARFLFKLNPAGIALCAGMKETGATRAPAVLS